MKLKLTHRLLLYIGALLIIAMGIAILLGSLQFNSIPIRSEGQGFLTLTRLALLLAGVIAVCFGVFCLSLPHRMKLGKTEFITRKTPSGELKISVQAIEAIISKSLAQYEEIKMQQLKVSQTKGGLEVDLRASLANNIVIPDAVNAISQHIHKQLHATLGVEAKAIRVIVDKADLQASASKYQLKNEELKLGVRETTQTAAADTVAAGNQKEGGVHGKTD